MKKLVGEAKRIDGAHAFSRRDFLIAGALGIAALATGCATTTAQRKDFERIPDAFRLPPGMRKPAIDYYDPTSSKVRIYGVQASELYLPKPIPDLIRSSERAKNLEERDPVSYKVSYRVEPVRYSGELVLYREKLSEEDLNSLRPEIRKEVLEKGKMDGRIDKVSGFMDIAFIKTPDGGMALQMGFPEAFDSAPQIQGRPGVRAFNLDGFSALVKKAFGADIGRVQIIFYEKDSFVTAHAIPVDAQGNVLTRLNGGIVAYGMSFGLESINRTSGIYGDGGISFLHESK